MPPSPAGDTVAAAPIGVDLISPPMLTECLDGAGGAVGLVVSESLLGLLAFWALALFSSTIHAGWLVGRGVGFGLGESGLFRAVSNQLALVGLHRRGSMVLDGLTGIVTSSFSATAVLLALAGGVMASEETVLALGVLSTASGSDCSVFSASSACSTPCLEPGRDDSAERTSERSRNMLVGRDLERAMLDRSPARPEAMVSPLAMPGGEATLHLLTLSDLFIMALCTKPPMPLVGDGGFVGEERPDTGDAVMERPRSRIGAGSSGGGVFSEGGSSRGPLARDSGDARPRARPWRGGFSGVSVETTRLVMPGSWARMDDMSKVSASSTWFFR